MSCRKNLDAELWPPGADVAGQTGPRYWRSLEELSDTEEFRRLMEGEFPSGWPSALDAVSRRKFLTLMGASLALAGINGCSVKPAPTSEIVPYVRQPEEIVPGKPLFYATAMTLDGAATGLLVETHLGRPTKIEGNPDHPASRGATSPQHQAAVLELYDPDRSQTVRFRGQTRTWADAAEAIRQMIEKQRAGEGAGLRLLTESVVSPTLAAQMQTLLRQLPEAKWHVWEPINRDAAYQAARWAFGQPVLPRYDFTKAERILSLDADFLDGGPGRLRYAADYMQRRRAAIDRETAESFRGGIALLENAVGMSRLYVVETAISCTGAKADHRLAVECSDIGSVALAFAAELGLDAGGAGEREHAKWIAAAARDLAAHRGTSLVLAGDRQPAAVHLLAAAMNDHLGNVGKTVEYIDPIEARPVDRMASLGDLTEALHRGEVECLIVLSGNPALTAPADSGFVAALEKAPLRIHLGLYEDETARLCHWHLPEAHFLEAWSDTRAFDGTPSIVQPVIEPLHGGRSAHEVLALLTDSRETPGRDIVRDYWRSQWAKETQPGNFAARWQTALHDGVIPNTRAAARSVTLASDWRSHVTMPHVAEAPYVELELLFLPDPSLHDGRFANNGWLQELPKPLTKITWGNVAMMSPATAEELQLAIGSYAHGGEHGGYYMPVVELSVGKRTISAPVWIMPGMAHRTVAVWLGNGRQHAGRVGGSPEHTVGFDAYRLRTAEHPWCVALTNFSKTGGTELVACTQAHHSMEGREPVRSMSLAEFEHPPKKAHGAKKQPAESKTLYEPFDYSAPKNKWGMSIDLTSCIGCNACVVACQAENNIPVVGKDEVARGREMHWIRVDRYMEGPAEQPTAVHFQPLPCMHCENAPCEYVCPVAATVHSADGLNEMIYNRCVGTRFCSNNCPYKVRRFNFLAFADFESADRRMQYNPDVTVRSRGVMEKCTYCVQRLRQRQIGAETTGRKVADGDVLTACQAACPTRAIVFGDMNDPRSKVKQAKDSPLHYALLEDLNTVPRTTYLTELRNPNPEIADVRIQS